MNELILLENMSDEIIAEKKEIQKKLANLPCGFLRINKCRNYTQWYAVLRGKSRSIGRVKGWRLLRRSKDRAGIVNEYYLPKKEIEFAKELALREYYERRYVQITRLNEMIERYVQPIDEIGSKRAAKTSNSKSNAVMSWRNVGFGAEKQELIRQVLSITKPELENWMKSDYPHNPKHTENLRYESLCGLMMRSRIEVIIANLLTYYGIPFRYEQRFVADDGTSFYPDFVIINPKTGKKYVWEHLGFMDIEQYEKATLWKLTQLFRMGYVPGDTLLFTGESESHIVNMNAIFGVINYIRNDENGERNSDSISDNLSMPMAQ